MVEITQTKKVFTQESAQEILPIIYSFTERTQNLSKDLLNQIYYFRAQQSSEFFSKIKALEKELDEISTKWQTKISRLGAIPKGSWLVDFDNGQGYYCWKFPEKNIQFFHSYHDGFTKRSNLNELREVLATESDEEITQKEE